MKNKLKNTCGENVNWIKVEYEYLKSKSEYIEINDLAKATFTSIQ